MKQANSQKFTLTMNKIIRAFWFFTLLTALGALLYSYASIPDGYDVYLTDSFSAISREVLFYIGLAIVTLTNFSIYSIARKYKHAEDDLQQFVFGWLTSFAAVLNFFLIVSFFFIQLINSGEKFDFTNFGLTIYITLGLIALWVLALPVFLLRIKK